jgi:integrase
MPLSDVAIRNAKPRERPWKLSDGSGLYVLINPNGSKWWRFKYVYGGREKLLSVGVYPDVGLKQARAGSVDARRLLSGGIDPGAVRKAAKAAKKAQEHNSVEAFCRTWLAFRADEWTPGTLEAITASFENWVFPRIGSRPLAEVTPAEIRIVVEAIDASGAGETARRVFQRIRSVYKYAMQKQLVAADPTYALSPREIFKRWTVTHRAAVDESEAPALLRAIDGYTGDPTTRRALQLLLLTILRPAELRGALRTEFDLDGALWKVDGQRMKMKTARPHLVPLSRQAVELVREILAEPSPSPYLFPSTFYPSKPISDGTLNSALARMGFKGTHTAHGGRTLFSTLANEGGWRGEWIEKQLSHEERDKVRDAYNNAQYLADRRELMQWWADRLDQLRAQTGDTLKAA